MPQIDLKLTEDISADVDMKSLFDRLEAMINDLDASAGACKCRLNVANDYKNSHALLQVGVLRRPHRDDDFMQDLNHRTLAVLQEYLPAVDHLGVELRFLDYYNTGA